MRYIELGQVFDNEVVSVDTVIHGKVLVSRVNADLFITFVAGAGFFEPYHSVDFGKQGVVLAYADVVTGVELGTSRMFPARQACPSLFLGPRRLASLSRPFLVLPIPFLWANN